MNPLPNSLCRGPPSLGMSPGPRRPRLFWGATLCPGNPFPALSSCFTAVTDPLKFGPLWKLGPCPLEAPLLCPLDSLRPWGPLGPSLIRLCKVTLGSQTDR